MAVTAKFIADFTTFSTAVRKAEVDLRSFEAGANKVEKALRKMTDDFSGRKIIQDATLMASAIDRAGGASKLTEAELRRVATVTAEAADKMRRLGIDVPKSFNDIAEAARRVKEPTEGITTKMIALGTAAGTFLGRLAYDAVKALAAGVVDLATQGVKMAPVVSAFEKLTAGIGETADVMLRTTRTATKGLITDLDIMAASNKAMLLGLPVSAKEMGVLGAAAVTLGKAMKQDAAKSLDDLITALGRSSPMILDNLGLTVKVGEANERYARQVGKSAESLTDAEKKLAFYNAAMDAARKKVDELGGVQLTLADQVLRVKNQFTNFTDALGVAIARSPALEALFGSLADSMESAFGGNQVTRVQELVKWVNEVAIAAVGVGQSFIELTKIGTGTFTFLKDGILGLLEAQFRVRAGLRDLIPTDQYRQEAAILRAMADSLRDQAEDANATQAQLERTLDAAAAAAGRMQQRMKDAAATQASAAVIAADLVKKLGKPAGVAGVSEDVTKAMDSIRRAVIPLTQAQQAQVREWERQGVSAETMAKALNVSTVAVQQHLESQKLLEKEIATVNVSMAKFTELVSDGAIQSGLRQIHADMDTLTGDFEKWKREFGGNNKSAIFPDWVGGQKDFEAWKKSMGGGIKETLPLFTKLRSVAGTALSDLNDIFQRAFEGGGGVGGAIKSFSTKMLKGLLELIPGVGKVLGQFAGAITAGVSKVWDSLFGTAGRDTVREFAKSMGGFDALHSKLLMMGDAGERLWIRLTQGVGRNNKDEAIAAIQEVTDAFDLHTRAFQKLEDVARKYSLTIEEMGPAWARQELDKKAQELFEDYQILTAGGVDHLVVLGKMASAVNKYVNDAVKMGVEVPAAMKPMLEDMVKSGQLIDANGNKVENLETAGVSFAMTMSEGFRALISEVQKLTDVISKGLGTAIRNIPDATLDIHGRYIPPKNVPQDMTDVVPMASGGMGRVTKPTLFLAGEGGPEDFAFSGANRKFGSPTGDRPLLVRLEVDGFVLGEVLVRAQERYA